VVVGEHGHTIIKMPVVPVIGTTVKEKAVVAERIKN
jgi:hypothetical protein